MLAPKHPEVEAAPPLVHGSVAPTLSGGQLKQTVLGSGNAHKYAVHNGHNVLAYHHVQMLGRQRNACVEGSLPLFVGTGGRCNPVQTHPPAIRRVTGADFEGRTEGGGAQGSNNAQSLLWARGAFLRSFCPRRSVSRQDWPS